MRVKRFVAPTMREVMLKVKKEMGQNAVILHTRNYKEGGLWGFFGKKMVEVTAAAEEEDKIKNEKKEKKLIWSQFSQEKDENNYLGELKREIVELKKEIKYNQYNVGLNRIGEKMYSYLIKNEVEDILAKRLIKSALDEAPYANMEDQDYLTNSLKEKIYKILKVDEINSSKIKKNCLTYAFIGPTGVGKTTTISKLAADFAIHQGKKVALITADTYRIAAVDQIKTVGEVINVPVDVVFSPKNLKERVLAHADKDIIFIDTAGRSYKNRKHMIELKSFLTNAQPDKTFLVLSSTTKYKDMLEIANSFSQVNFDNIIFTKLDETSTWGPILNLTDKFKKSIAYITDGQNVPDDIKKFNAAEFVEMIWGEAYS